MNEIATPTTAERRPRALTLGTVLLLALALAGVVGLALLRRTSESRERQSRADVLAKGPAVRVATVEVGAADRTLKLPGEVRAWAQSTLYSKVAGYVREVRVDKGAKVKKGDLLARIESPETDQLVASARASLKNAEAQADRLRQLRPQGFVAQSDVDTAEAALGVTRANLQTALATQQYAQLRAPFDGVVTSRYVDVGALVAAGTASNSAVQPLFDVADMRTLRVQVYVGQDDADAVKTGTPVTITAPDDPGHPIEARVTRTSQGIDGRTRTMLVEVDVPNEPVRLFPGGYVNVTLKFAGRRTPTVPSDALAWRGDRLYVATLGSDDRVKLLAVQAGQDDGKRIQVLSGVSGGERVVLNPSAELADGDPVQPQQPTAPPVAAPAR